MSHRAWIAALLGLSLSLPTQAADVNSDSASLTAVPHAPAGLHLVRSAIALGANPDGSPIEAKTFYKNEEVHLYTELSFDPTSDSGREHHLTYKWYTGDALTLTFGGSKRLAQSPAHWWAFVHTAHFPAGHHRVELFVDDGPLAANEFDTKSVERPTEPAEDTALKESVAALLLAGNTSDFDALAKGYRASHERTASGTWKLGLLYSAIDR